MKHLSIGVLAAALSLSCGGGHQGLHPTSITCPAGRTLLDGVCVAESVADYVACVRAQGAHLGGAKSERISAEAGTLGVHAGGAEVSETLEKRYSASDAAMMEIIRSCNLTARRATGPAPAVTAPTPAVVTGPPPGATTAPSPVAAAIDPGDWYRLGNAAAGEGYVLDTYGDGENAPFMQRAGNFGGQLWKRTPLPDGTYRLSNAFLGDARALDTYGDGENKPFMGQSGRYTAQYWKLTPLGDGTYRLTNRFLGEGRSLEARADKSLRMAATSDAPGQRWTLIKDRKR